MDEHEPSSNDPVVLETLSNITSFDPTVFASIQTKVEEESRVKDVIRGFTETLQGRSKTIYAKSTYMHFLPDAQLKAHVLDPVDNLLLQQAKTIQELAAFASQYPFYKFNFSWGREVADVIRAMQINNWLRSGNMLNPQEVAEFLGVKAIATNEDGDVFHITLENYLFGLIDATEELSRLAQNSVIIGDLWRPEQLSRLVRDVHQSFQMLNLKNDNLRRRVDGIKYSVKRVEEVMYDLKLRGMIQEKPGAATNQSENYEQAEKKVKQGGDGEQTEMKD